MGLALVVSDVHRDARSGGRSWGASDWKAVNERVVSFAKRRAGLEWEEGRLLREAQRAGVHRRLGFASFSEYVGRLFGYNGRLVKEKLRVAQALETLPRTSECLHSGGLTWSATRELTRVATGETEVAWLDATRGQTVRQVEEMVSGRRPGDLPSDAEDPKLWRYVLRFEVTGETRATLLDALAKLRRDASEPLDDDTALLLMARQVLAGSSMTGKESSHADSKKAEDNGRAGESAAAPDRSPSAGRSNYQVQVTVCKQCRRGEQTGNGERHAIATATLEMSLCDAQVLGESYETGTAKQTIPPALRRYVVRRDHGRCVVSGCRHAMFVDVHHLVPRAESGQHEPDNLACVCAAHHRAVHEGRLLVEGRPSTGLSFRHADGSRYGTEMSANAADRNARVFAGLRGMGFKETDCRRALDTCSKEVAGDATREEMLRAALEMLTS